MSLLTLIVLISLSLTVIVMVVGIGSMARGGEFDEKHDAQLMTARVGMQAVTLLFLSFVFYEKLEMSLLTLIILVALILTSIVIAFFLGSERHWG